MKQNTSLQELAQLEGQERAALSDYLRRLRGRFEQNIRQIIFFGSRARGEGDAESDLDLLIVLDNADWRFHDEVALESYPPSLEHSVLISPLTMYIDDFQWHQRHGEPLYQELEKDGVELWTMTPALL